MPIAKLLPEVKEIRKFILIFYAVACIGFILPFSREFFIQLTPLALLVNVILLLIFDENKNKKKAYIAFTSCFLLGLGIEIIGVNTGILFGNYQYFEGLGIQLFNTPLIIGVNWLVLVYLSRNLVEKSRLSIAFKIILSALIMLGYDVLLEQLAPQLRFWIFEYGVVPIQNYLAWFVVAILLHIIFVLFKVNTENKLAKTLFAAQSIFFVFLFIILR